MDEAQVEKRAVSLAMRRRVIAEQGGICARGWCEAPAADVDHILPLWLKGKNARANLEGLCGPCHAAKTKAEAKVRAKCKRLAGETCTARGKPIPQRPEPWGPKGVRKLQSGGFRRAANDDRRDK